MEASTATSAKGSRNRAARSSPRKPRAADPAGAAADPQPQAKLDALSQFAGKTIASVFGEMVWLLSRSPKYRELKLSDLEWLIMPPLLLRQFKLFYAGQTPIALELHAKVSPAVAARLDAGDKKLAPGEWRSGDLQRLVERVELLAESLNVQPESSGVAGTFSNRKQ